MFVLGGLLRPYIEAQTTLMREPVDVVKKVACTLYYLSDEGRLRKTANSFGLARQTVSKIIRETILLALKPATILLTELLL